MDTTISEKLDVGFVDRAAVVGVGDVVHGFARERLLGNGRIVDPDDDLIHIAAVDFCGQQIGARFLQRGGNGNAAVEMVFTRLESELPLGSLLANIFRLVLVNQAMADVLDVQFIPVETCWIRFEIGFDIAEQLVDLDCVRLELDSGRVAITKVDRCAFFPRAVS